MKTEKSEAREGTEELRRRSCCQAGRDGGGRKGAGERASEGTSQVLFFFFLLFFPLSDFLLLLFLFFVFSPRAEPLCSLARSSTHTRRHVPRVRSPERAACAGRDGDGSGSGCAGKRKQPFFSSPWNFLSARCFSLCLLRQRMILSLDSSERGRNASFTPAGLLRCGPLQALRE